MTQPEIIIRPAKPSQEEGLRFAHFMNIAANGGFRYLLGPRFKEIVAEAFVEPGHDLSHEYALLAEQGGEILGMASGYTAEQHGRSSDEPIRRAAGRSAFRMACMFALTAPMWRFMHAHEEGDFYLQFLAVDEPHRGQGAGSALIGAMEARGRESGSVRFVLDVSGRNPGAQRLYERQGFEVGPRWPRLALLPPIVRRMVKPLDPGSNV